MQSSAGAEQKADAEMMKAEAELKQVDGEIEVLETSLSRSRSAVAQQHAAVTALRNEILDLERSTKETKKKDGTAHDDLRSAISQKSQELHELRQGLTRMQRLITERTAQLYI